MPLRTINGAKLWIEDTGTGAETIVFAHGLLWSGRMFAPQFEALRDRYRCVTLDFRGQGKSEVAASGYDMDTLAADAKVLIEDIGPPVHFVGLSMGGFVGMRLAARHPALLRTLTLLATAGDAEPKAGIPKYRAMAFISRIWMRPLLGSVMKIMFGDAFLADASRRDRRRELEQVLLGLDKVGMTRALEGVITRAAVEDELPRISIPTLVLAGEDDHAVVPERQRRTAGRIPGAELRMIPRAGHTSTLEEPAAIVAALTEFLAKHRPA
ncbi:MAG TPA: alpha/beta fold hydrolase [Haliangiales bacterium]|nr:alpha/beta fold hydrolase [Haliangiales bacterium]